METIPAPRSAALDTLFELAGCGDVWLYQRIMQEMGTWARCSRCNEFMEAEYDSDIYGRDANGTLVTYACTHCCEIIEQEGKEEFEQALPNELIRVKKDSMYFISKRGELYTICDVSVCPTPKISVCFIPNYYHVDFGEDGTWHHNSLYEHILRNSEMILKSKVVDLFLEDFSDASDSDNPISEDYDAPDDDFTEEDLFVGD